jgi:hypothetical protein
VSVRPLLSALGVAVIASALASGAACSRTEPAPGVLMLAIQTDMSAGRDKTIQAMGLYVRDLDRNRTLFQLTEPVAPDGTVKFPATLAIIGRNNPGASIRIRVVGFRRGEAQVMRDAVTTIPTDRTALMALPLRWVNYEKAQGAIPQGGNTTPSVHTLADDDPANDPFGVLSYKGCAGESTFIDGLCVPWTVDSSKLPDFVESDVFGGGTASGGGGTCFDTEKCFAKSTPLALEGCVAPKPAGAFTLAVKQALGEEGACAGDGCFIPLDAESDEGWKTEGNNIRLTAGTCQRIVDGHHTLVASLECGSKTANAPLCGEASAVGPGTDLPIDLDAGDATLTDGRVPDDGGLDAGAVPFELATGFTSPTQIVQDTSNLYFVTRGGIVFRSDKKIAGATAINAGFDAGAPTAEYYKIAITPAKDHLVLGQVAGVGGKSYAIPSGLPVTFLNTSGGLNGIAASSTNFLNLDTSGTLHACLLTGCSGTESPLYQFATSSFLAYDPTLDAVFFVAVTTGNPASLSLFRHETQTPTGQTNEIARGVAPAGPIVFDVGATGNVYWMTTGPTGGIYGATKTSGASTSLGALIANDDFTNPGGGITKVTHELVVDNNELFWTNAKGEVKGAKAAAPASPQVLAKNQNIPMGITVDASFIYWTTMGDGKVWRLPRTKLP